MRRAKPAFVGMQLIQIKKIKVLASQQMFDPSCFDRALDFQEIVSTKKRLPSLTNIPSDHECTKVTYVTLHVQHVSAKLVFKSEKHE